MNIRIYLILIIALFSVSSTSLIVRYLVSVPALTLAFWRMFSSGTMLWGYTSIKPRISQDKISIHRVVVAGLFLGLHFSLFFWGIRETSIANATLLANTGPFFTAIFSWINKEQISKKTMLGLLLSFIGICVVQSPVFSLEDENTKGNLLCLASGLCLAITYIYASKIRKKTSALVYSRSAFLIASLTIALVSIITDVSLFDFEKKHILWFLALGLFPSILGHNLLTYSIKYLTPTSVASIPLGEPIIASVFASFWFSEKISPEVFPGGGLILMGIFMVLQESKNH